MRKNNSITKRLVAFVVSMVMVFTMVPNVFALPNNAKTPGKNTDLYKNTLDTVMTTLTDTDISNPTSITDDFTVTTTGDGVTEYVTKSPHASIVNVPVDATLDQLLAALRKPAGAEWWGATLSATDDLSGTSFTSISDLYTVTELGSPAKKKAITGDTVLGKLAVPAQIIVLSSDKTSAAVYVITPNGAKMNNISFSDLTKLINQLTTTYPSSAKLLYLTTDWQSYEDALAAANNIKANTNSEQRETAYLNLKSAGDTLAKNGKYRGSIERVKDTVGLTYLQAADEDLFEKNGIAAFNAADIAARAAAAKENTSPLSQSTFNTKYLQPLQTAAAKLVPNGDTTKQNLEVYLFGQGQPCTVAIKLKDTYTKASYDIFFAAYTAAVDALDKYDSGKLTSTQLLAYHATVITAVAGLETTDAANSRIFQETLSALEALIAEANEIEKVDGSEWDTLQDAIGYARYVINAVGTTKSDENIARLVDAKTDLEAAMKPFEKPIKEGWIEEDGKWYFYENDVKVTKAWRTLGIAKYYFDDNGSPITGWDSTIDGKWRHFMPDGILLTGWHTFVPGNDPDFTYYFDPADNGVVKMGWFSVNGSWYCSNAENAIVLKGWWQLAANTWFYFDANGAAYVGGVFTNPAGNPVDPDAVEVEFNADGKYMGPADAVAATIEIAPMAEELEPVAEELEPVAEELEPVAEEIEIVAE